MKELNDEELQRMLETGKQTPRKSPGDDEKAYQALFEALNTGPEAGLPFDFAAKVTRGIATEQKRSNELRYNLIAGAIFLGLIALLCGIMTAYGTVDLPTILKYKWPLVLLPIAFIAIQYLDQVLIKVKIFRNHPNS
jgi:hypothetical protein